MPSNHTAIRRSTFHTTGENAWRIWLFVILLVALLMRLLVLNYTLHRPLTGFYEHPWEMGLLANSLIHHLGYSSPFGVPTGPTAFIAPGYPTLVAGVFLIFGAYTFQSAVVLMLLNVGAALATIALMMRLARELFGLPVAFAAGIFWAVSLPVLWLPVVFWESCFSALFFVVMLTLALRCRRMPTRVNWILLGAFTGAAALVNPALMPSFVAMMGWLAFEGLRNKHIVGKDDDVPVHSSWKTPMLGVLALVLVFIAWPIRNAIRFHAFIPLRSTVGFELWVGNRDGSNGRLDESLYPMFDRHELNSYLAEGEVAYTHNKSDEAWRWVRTHPAAFAKLTARRFYRFWSGTGNIKASATYEAHALVTTLLGWVGLLMLFRRSPSLAMLFALPVLLFPLPYYITHAEFRYRLNLDPILTILAAYAAVQIAFAVAARTTHRPVARHAAPVALSQ